MSSTRKIRTTEYLNKEKMWHPMMLQSLPARKFIQVANLILSGSCGIMTYGDRRLTTMH